MKIKSLTSILLITLLFLSAYCADKVPGFSATIRISDELQADTKSEGRLFVFITKQERGMPMYRTWASPQGGNENNIFAVNISGLDPAKPVHTGDLGTWDKTPDWTFENVPAGEYYIQALWDQDTEESRIIAPGNLYSEKQKVKLNGAKEIEIVLDQKVEPPKVREHELVRVVEFKSDALSDFWDRPFFMKASILLPADYDESEKYPIRYNVAGYGGRHTRINWTLRNEDFMGWWESDEAPRVINVFLDGEGPLGDPYYLDSENNGPWGHALIHELIPHIESEYRGTDSPDTRFVDGCSTGGWVSLALQLFYPDHFNGTFSYSPDAIDFENYQLTNVYEDENIYYNEYGYLRPVMRDLKGEPMVSFKTFIQYENVLGASGTYLNSGSQIGAHTAVYSPKGENNLPKPMFDHVTGEIDHEVAGYWKKYDLKIVAEENWEEIGPKLQGKIYIWMGDMDQFYLNTGTRGFADFINNTSDPVSDAVIEFTPLEGHCSQFSNRAVLMKIKERLASINGE